jgi:hypothetical protein
MSEQESLREKIAAVLLSNRSSLSEASVKTYTSLLSSILKMFNSNDTSLFTDFKRVLNRIYLKPKVSKKAFCAALYVFTKLPVYQTEMMLESRSYTADIKKQVVSEKQRNSWVTTEQINEKFLELQNKYFDVSTPFQLKQNYVILALMGGKYIPPRRNKDWTEMKIRNVNEDCNYIDEENKEFVFKKYKTSSTYGIQRIAIPEELLAIINHWKTINVFDFIAQ